MATYTYDEDQVAEADQVKFHAWQTGTTAADRDFTDEEIAAVLGRVAVSGRAKPYKAAAELVRAAIGKYGSIGKGIREKKISKLVVIYGGRNTKLEVLWQLKSDLEKEAARLSRAKPRGLRLINVAG